MLALAARAWVGHDIARLPFFEAPISDARSYLDWAHRIASGDWLGRSEGQFYQAPLYPYFLAALELFVGAEALPATARIAQALLAACAVLFLARRMAVVAGVSAGRATAWLGALFPPALAADAQIQKESLAFALACVALGFVLQDVARPSWRALFGAAIALGALSLVRETALVLLAALWLMAAVQLSAAGDKRATNRGRLVAVGLGTLLALAPGAIRSLWVTGELALTTTQGGPNFFIGNHRGATGSYVPLVVGRGAPAFERLDARRLAEAATGRALSDREVSRYWFRRGLELWRAEPLAAVRLTVRKARLLAHRVEIADVEDFELQRESSALLRILWPALGFGTLLPFAAAGLVLSSRRAAAHRLAIWIVVAAAATIAFYILGRYRVLLWPALIVGAALLFDALRGDARRIRPRRLGLAVLLAAILALAANSPRAALGIERRGMASVNLGVAHATRGDLSAAETAYRRALEIEPGLFEAELNLGNLLRVTGRAREAIPHLERAVARSPEDEDAHRELGAARAQAGIAPTKPLLPVADPVIESH